MAKTMIVHELLSAAEKSMHGIESARLDAEILLASSMNIDRASLYAFPEREVADEVVTNFHDLLKKRRQQYPVSYLTGRKEFWSLQLRVDQYTLVPRPETECLVEAALQIIPGHQPYDILDLGTGSGAIALAIASERPVANVLATDVSEGALAKAGANAREHNISNVTFKKSDWFRDLQGCKFDMILSNPPYVESSDPGFVSGEIRHEPRLALDGGEHGMELIAHLVPAARAFLVPGGHLLLEHGYLQAPAIRSLLVANHYQRISSGQDYAGLDRFTLAQGP